ncbi:unnamed protein product [Sphenostylis stenocarpa]|uniref:E3 ubiquitin-protein ligase RMA n=1 Tax=Sphenostylis stenocarpa TaxID=92480 RepID=A0AA86T2H9_9FABA|nr:unnamed protein product [Sphenostylis stenocarpa]
MKQHVEVFPDQMDRFILVHSVNLGMCTVLQDRLRRLLEAVPSRARQHQDRPPVGPAIQISNPTEETVVGTEAQVEGIEHQRVEERVDGSAKRRIMKGVHLIAKALEDVEVGTRKHGTGSGNFFECNICLRIAKDPVLTCCGHLFCWTCFYRLPYSYGDAKECPACDGEVIDTNITPIYGNASGSGNSDAACSTVPPRPAANRINRFS